MTFDLRTRTDGPTPPVDAQVLFGTDLPAMLEERGSAVTDGMHWLAPRPLVIETPDGAWSLVWTGTQVVIAAVQPGVTAPKGTARVRLSAEQLDDVVYDRGSFMGMFSSGQLDQPEGRLTDLLDWWLVLRAAFDDQAVHVPGSIDFVDRDGAQLDLGRAFRPDDDPDDMRWFLEQAGFLHIEGLFTEAEMSEVSRDMDRAAPSYSPDDHRSWWARTADGENHLVRMQAFDTHSPITASLIGEDRFLAIGELPHEGYRFADRRADNRIEALFKPIGIVEGISDVPWHKDCSLGRHSYECCSLTVGISVSGADATSGQLRVVAGSHRALVWPAFVRPGAGLPEIDLPTTTGDVTVHLSCTTHMAQPPVDRERRVMYTGFSLPVPEEAKEAASRERRRLREVREAAPVSVSQTPGHTGS